MASAISAMDGVQGLSNWRWIFILEGIATIVIGFVSYFCLADFPDQASWLTEEERRFVIARAGIDKEPARPVTSRDVLWFFTDAQRILGGFMYFCEISFVASCMIFALLTVFTMQSS